MNAMIIRGQHVNKDKLKRAKELRSQMTTAEEMLWEQLRANRLAGLHFRRQQVIDGFIVDFYCHKAGLVIEVDGAIHETTHERDQARDQILSGKGLTIIRFANQEINTNLSRVLETIEHACNTSISSS